MLGGLLWWVHDVRSSEARSADERTIVVDRQALLAFLERRSRAQGAPVGEALLQRLSPAERQRAVEDLVRDEVLYREALALGLERDDYVIRQRLVQKMDFVLRGARVERQPSEEQLRQWLDEHADDYRVDARVTFAHVFFDAQRHGREGALALAEQELPRLNREHVPFSDAGLQGDRFPFHRNYVERDQPFVASQFGGGLAAALFALEPDEERWQGPLESVYGAHLVLLTQREAARLPELDEVRARVEQDVRRAVLREESEAAVRALVDGYDVRIELPEALGADGP